MKPRLWIAGIILVAGVGVWVLGRRVNERASGGNRVSPSPMPSAASRAEDGDVDRHGKAVPANDGARDLAVQGLKVASGGASNGTVGPAPVPKMFGELIDHGELQTQERRMFQAEKWEVNLAKALDLPANVRLERRSGTFYAPDFKYPNVRVDRVYRMDSAVAATINGLTGTVVSRGGSWGASTSGVSDSGVIGTESSGTIAANGVSGASAAVAVAQTGGGLMDAGGGTAVWENAMVGDHVMVQVQPGVTQEQLAAALPASTALVGQVTSRGLYLVSIPTDGDNAIGRAVLALGGLKDVVQFAEPDFLSAGADTTPNDPLFTTNASDTTKQWHLPKIMAPRAWDVIDAPKNATVANETVVAVVDTGVDYNHPDLAANIWTNPNPGSYGYANDVHGWNFVDSNNNPMDDVGHGTHVAGIIGAIGNNGVGTSGVCWGVKILPLRVIKALGNGTYGAYSDAIAAMDYIYVLNQAGRRVAVANHSWGGNGYSLAMLNAINNPVNTNAPLPSGLTATYTSNVNILNVSGKAAEIAKITVGMNLVGTGIPANVVVTSVTGSSVTISDYSSLPETNTALTFSNPIRAKPYGVVHVAAAGNSQFNLDRIPIYPACLPSSFIISVGASDTNDAISIWTSGAGSNFGGRNVHLFAPGSSIWSTYWIPSGSTGPTGFIPVPGSTTDGYVALNGTSMAAPQVTGAIALVRMWQPNLTDYQARQVVIEQVDAVTTLNGKCASGGRLNIAKVIDRLYQPILVSSGGGTGGGSTSSVGALNAAAGVRGRMAANDTAAFYTKGGKVYAWGYNYLSDLGVEGTGFGHQGLEESLVPMEIPNFSDVIMVAASTNCGLALKADGTVWGWGYGGDGQLGPGNGDVYTSPIQIPSLSNVVWISANEYHCLAVKTDGTVWGWGQNYSGQLGNGASGGDVITPVKASGLDHVIQAEAGRYHSVALKDDGTVWCWGERDWVNDPYKLGALGDGVDSGFSSVPVQAQGITTAVFVAAGEGYSAAVLADGTVREWGGYWGYDAGTFHSAVPVQKAGLQNIVMLALGNNHALALDQAGNVFAWGHGMHGELGTGVDGNVSSVAPVTLPAGTTVASIQTAWSHDQEAGNSLALTGDGGLLMWGENRYGQLGTSKKGIKYNAGIAKYLSNISHSAAAGIGGGGTHYGLLSDGSIVWWGTSLVDPTVVPFQSQRPLPVDFLAAQKFTNVVCGETMNGVSAFAIRTDGTVCAWGTNNVGQLGDGTTTSLYTSSTTVTGVANVSAMATTRSGLTLTFLMPQVSPHCLAISGGTLAGWGSNDSGQLGGVGLTGFTQVACGLGHSLARKSNGTVWSWGLNSSGQLGNAGGGQISGLTNVIQVGAIDQSSWAVKSDGTVWAWGDNSYGQLGLGSLSNQSTPVMIPGISNASKIIPTPGGVYVIRQDGTVLGWGFSAGRIGASASGPDSYTNPVPVLGLTGIVDLWGSQSVTNVLRSDGTFFSWGDGASGALADGDAWSSVPSFVVSFGGAAETFSTLGTGDPADSWYFQNFSTNELILASVISDTAAPAGDGIPNLVKYALGLNPKQYSDSSVLPTARIDLIGGSVQSVGVESGIGLFSVPTADLINGKHYMAYTVARNGIHLDVDYIVEVSTDMIHWASGDPNTVTVLDTANTLEVYSATPLDDVPRQFMRLRIQRK